MKKLKIYLILLSYIFFSGCFQSTALFVPGYTVATSGNVLQAGIQYGINTAVKEETGEYPLEHIKKTVKKKKKQKKFDVVFKNFLENRIEATRKKFSLN